jgi:cytochrome c oxidase subunit 4
VSAEGHTSTKVYLLVFLWLGIFTAVTVAASYLHLPAAKAIALALTIATIKATIVGLFFMHLKFEGRVILAFLALTAAFGVVLVTLPSLDTIGHEWAAPGATPPVPAVHTQQQQDDFNAGKAPAEEGHAAEPAAAGHAEHAAKH